MHLKNPFNSIYLFKHSQYYIKLLLLHYYIMYKSRFDAFQASSSQRCVCIISMHVLKIILTDYFLLKYNIVKAYNFIYLYLLF